MSKQRSDRVSVTAAAGVAAARRTEAVGARGERLRFLRHRHSPGHSPVNPEQRGKLGIQGEGATAARGGRE